MTVDRMIDEGYEFLVAFPAATPRRLRGHLEDVVSGTAVPLHLDGAPWWYPEEWRDRWPQDVYGWVRRWWHRRRIDAAVAAGFADRRP